MFILSGATVKIEVSQTVLFGGRLEIKESEASVSKHIRQSPFETGVCRWADRAQDNHLKGHPKGHNDIEHYTSSG